MGLLDSIMAKIPGLAGGQLNSVIEGFKDDPSKLTGLLNDLHLGGLGDQVKSWIGTGENQAVSADQIKQALPQEKLEQIATNQGVTTDEAADGISKVLPDLVNEITPDGVVPSGDVIKERLGALAGS